MVDGDPRVVYSLAALLSLVYAAVVVYGASAAGYVSFTPSTVVVVAVVVLLATHFALLR